VLNEVLVPRKKTEPGSGQCLHAMQRSGPSAICAFGTAAATCANRRGQAPQFSARYAGGGTRRERRHAHDCQQPGHSRRRGGPAGEGQRGTAAVEFGHPEAS
jgi:hypothetical protein